MRFCKGNRVEIQSSCGTTKGTGEVIRYIDYPPKIYIIQDQIALILKYFLFYIFHISHYLII